MSKTKITVLAIVFIVAGGLLQSRFALAAASPDLNADGCVNQTDLTTLQKAMGTTNASLDMDGVNPISIKDIAVLLSHWQAVCTPTTGTALKLVFQGSWSSPAVASYLASDVDLIITKSGQTKINNLRSAATALGRHPLILHYYKFAGEHGPNDCYVNGTPATCEAPPTYWSAYTPALWAGPHSTAQQPTFVRAANDWYFADLTSASNRSLIVNLLTSALYAGSSGDNLLFWKNKAQIDGFFFDNGRLMTGGDTFERTEPDANTLISQDTAAYPTNYNAGAPAPYWDGKKDLISQIKASPVLGNPFIISNNFYNKTDFDTILPGHNRLEFLNVADGIMGESTFWENSSPPRPLDTPKANITIQSLALAPSNKTVVLYSYGNMNDTTARLYSLAGSLMVTHGNVYHFYGDTFHDDTPYYFPEYDAVKELGMPNGEYRIETDLSGTGTLYVRDYQFGRVVMNTMTINNDPTPNLTYNANGYQKLTNLVGSGLYSDPRSYSWTAATSNETVTGPGALILKK